MNLIDSQFIELRKKYSYLYRQDEQDATKIVGTIFFDNNSIKDEYEVEILIPKSYPKAIPLIRETKGKIPKSYHHNGGHFCLETPFRVWEIFRREETLLNFVDNLVVPYLALYSYVKNTGDSSKEHAHGAKGVLADYKKLFNLNDDLLTFKLLRILAEHNYRGHLPCPCGSGEKIRKCHGMCIYEIVVDERFRMYDFMQDFLQIAVQFKKDGIISDFSEYSTKNVLSYIESVKNNPPKKWGY